MRKLLLLLLLTLPAGVLNAEAPSAYAIRGARVVTVSGAVIDSGVVVIRDGLIADVGANVTIPNDAWIIEGKGLTVYPGLIDSISTLGIPEAAPAGGAARSPGTAATPATPAVITPTQQQRQQPAQPVRGPEDRPSNTSWIRAADLISPTDRRIESARNSGFTTAVTFPGRGIFAGQGAVINLAGERAGEMVVSSPAGLYITVPSVGFGGGGGGFPGSLMGVIAYIRQISIDAEHYRIEKAAYAKRPVGMKRPAYDRALEGVLESPRVLMPAQSAIEIDRMLRFAAELKMNAVIYGGHEAYRAAAPLSKAGVPVLVSLRWPERQRDEDPERVDSLRTLELRELAPSTPSALAKAGVRFAFYTDTIAAPRDLLRNIKRAMDAGLSQADAVRAFTLAPAEIYGLADRLGSIDKGKIANLVVTEGDLFQEKTRVKHVFIDGVKFEPTPESPEGEREGAR